MAAAAGLQTSPAAIAPAGPVPGGMDIADHQSVVALDHRKPGVSRSLLEPLEQSLRTPRPAADRGHQRGIHQQVEGDPSRRIGRRKRIAGAHRLRMRAFPGLDRDIEMARGVRHLGELGQVVAGQSVLLVRLDEQTERTRPVTGLQPRRVPAAASPTRSRRSSPTTRWRLLQAAVTPRATRVTVFLTHRG